MADSGKCQTASEHHVAHVEIVCRDAASDECPGDTCDKADPEETRNDILVPLGDGAHSRTAHSGECDSPDECGHSEHIFIRAESGGCQEIGERNGEHCTTAYCNDPSDEEPGIVRGELDHISLGVFFALAEDLDGFVLSATEHQPILARELQ